MPYRLPALMLAAAALAAACSWPPRDVAERNREIAERFDRESKAETAAEKDRADAVAPIVTALRAERNEATLVVFIKALDHLNDVRAVDGLIEAINQPGMSDQAREDALRTIYKYRAEWRLGPEIRKFYDSLTDPDVKGRVEFLVKRLEK